MALTATADAETRAEIVARLFDGRAPATFLRGFDRPNLVLAFRPRTTRAGRSSTSPRARRGLSGIVYCASRAKTEALAAALGEAGHTALAYHAGLDADDRRLAETRFQREDGLIVCATIAFGMGVDKPDIRYVAHADLPKSIEGYYQEIGRAGRDGAPADTLTLYGPDDIRLRRAQIDESPSPMERKQADHKRLNALLGLAEAPALPPPDAARLLRRDAGRALRQLRPLPRPPGALRRHRGGAQGLLGDAPHRRELRRRAPDRHPARRAHREGAAPRPRPAADLRRRRRTARKAEWQAIFRQLMGLDLIRPDPERHGALRLTEAARPVLRGEAALDAARRHASGAPPRPRRRAAPLALVGRGGRGAARGAEGEAPGAGRRRRRAGLRHLPRPHADRDGDPPAARRLDALRRHHRRRRGQARALRRQPSSRC